MTNKIRGIVLCLLLASPPTTFAQNVEPSNPIEAVGSAVKGLFKFLDNTVKTVLNENGSKLNAMVEAKDFEAAATFYLENEENLKDKESGKSLLPKIANGLNEKLASSARPAAERIKAISISPQQDEWSHIKHELGSARKLIAIYDKERLLQRPDLRSPAIIELTTAIKQAEENLSNFEASAFIDYDHALPNLFFEVYPLETDATGKAAIMEKGLQSFCNGIGRLPEDQAERIVRAYSALPLSEQARTIISTIYASVVVRSRNWSTQRGLGEIIKLAQALRGVGPMALT